MPSSNNFSPPEHLSPEQVMAITTMERVGSVFSLLGCLFIIVTFSSSKAFHKPINRLVFYASFGNMMTNVGTLMAREFLGNVDSIGCQLQAFLIQMFLPADAFWTLAMAVNVYLTFYFKFDARKLRKMEIWYALVCYGVPFIPAITYIFIITPERGRVFGNATLWCWVSSKWDTLRIATFYGPIWIIIIITMAIYIRAGGEIYQKRKLLRNFTSTTNRDPEPLTMDDPFSIKTTEVTVTTEDTNGDIGMASIGPREAGSGPSQPHPNAAYSVTITSSRCGNRASHDRFSMPIENVVAADPVPLVAARQGNKALKRRANYEANNAAWSYTKCAILFFTAILITWIPSSANRVYSVIHAGQVSIPLEFMSAFVLPLQGFWNAVIYVVTSWKATKMFLSDVGHRMGRRETASYVQSYGPNYVERRDTFKINSRGSHKTYESESMTELAQSTRPNSDDGRKVQDV